MEDYLVYKLMSQHLEIEELISSLDNKALHSKIDDKWSIFENIAHLGRYQEIFKERFNLILTGTCPSFDRYVAEKDINFPEWCKTDLSTNIEKIHTKRGSIVNSILTLPETDFNYLGKHPTFGKMILMDWIKFFLYHESHHLYQIFRLKHNIKSLKE